MDLKKEKALNYNVNLGAAIRVAFYYRLRGLTISRGYAFMYRHIPVTLRFESTMGAGAVDEVVKLLTICKGAL